MDYSLGLISLYHWNKSKLLKTMFQVQFAYDKNLQKIGQWLWLSW